MVGGMTVLVSVEAKKGGFPVFFSWGDYWFNTKKSWFNGKSGGRIWKVIIYDISLQREVIECLGEKKLNLKFMR